jgi:Fe2+ or Zn2+ uptake regulation protein
LVNEFCRTLETRSGYRLTASHLTLFGLCPACRDLKRGEAGNAALSP